LARFRKNYFICILILSCIAVLLVAWLSFGRHGLMDLYKMQKEKERCIAIVGDLREKNRQLAAEIRRLKEDQKYLESVARKELGLAKENEIIYRLKKGRKRNRRANDNNN
jgi:cell division protein FtsB